MAQPAKKVRTRKKQGPVGLTESVVVDALLQCYGNQQAAANMLRVTRESVSYWVKKSDACFQATLSGEEVILDYAESNLHKAAKRGDPWAVRYILSQKGKRRGYGGEAPLVQVQTNVEAGGNAAIAVSVNLDALPLDKLELLEGILAEAGEVIEGEIVDGSNPGASDSGGALAPA